MDHQQAGARTDAEGLWDWDLATDRVHFCPRWLSLVGCDEHEFSTTPAEWLDRVHPDDLDLVRRELDGARVQDRTEFDFSHRLRHKDGRYRWMSCRGVTVRDHNGQVVRLTGSHRDITAQHLADRVTGLPNAVLMSDRIVQSIELAERYPGFRFAVLLIEIAPSAQRDRHAGVDATLLNAVARRLETSLRVRDGQAGVRHADVVARVGEQRFGVLLDGLKDLFDAKTIGDRLLSETLAPFTINGKQVYVSASAGTAISATGYTEAESMLRDAETALRRAATLGGSHCEVFDTAILKSEELALRLDREMRPALERGEFQLLYQPIVAISSNHIIGFEALARWVHPELGAIAPAEFIPIAERNGFIVRLGEWILGEACSRMKSWQESVPAPGLWISVNLSSLQLKDVSLKRHVAEALNRSGLEPRSLVLELTEGSAMENPTAVKSLLMELRALGVRISVDDFGTGYSSLAYLRQFPIDALKMDRAFIRTLQTDKDAAAIVGSLTSMAKQLGLHVVAEGIETEEQLSVLRALQCESVQGYLFAAPLDEAAAGAMLQSALPLRPGERTRVVAAPSVNGFKPVAVPALPYKRFAVAAAALAVLATGGIAARFSASGGGADIARPQVNQVTAAPATVAAAAPAPPAPPATSPREAATRTVDAKKPGVAAAAPTPAPARKDAAGPSPRSESHDRKGIALAPLAAEPIKAPAPRAVSLSVEHLHRMGGCRGVLTASSAGVHFAPADSKDTFTLKLTDFHQELDREVLTLKSNQRTYRFRATDKDGIPLLKRLAANVAELQQPRARTASAQ